MKAPILLFLTTVLISAVSAQQAVPKPATHPANSNPDLVETIRRNRLHPPNPSGNHGPGDRGARIDLQTLTTPQLLTGFIRSQQPRQPDVSTAAPRLPAAIGRRPSPTTAQVRPTRSQTLGATCNNHAFFELIGLTHGVMYAGAMTHTQDDGIVISGTVWDSTAAHPTWQVNAYVLKCDNQGNILWVNLLVDAGTDPIYNFNPILVKEMSGGDLLVASYADYSQSGNANPVTTIYHLTAAGSTLWHTELKSILMQSDNNEWTYFSVKGISPGLNGDYILSGTTIAVNYGAQTLTVVRLDANGNYVWDVNLGNASGDYDLDAEGLNAYLSGNQIMAIGISHGDEFPYGDAATFFATLDYNTGAVENKRFWVNTTPTLETSPVYYNNYAVQENNGNYLVYAVLFSAFMMITDTIDYFGVQEYDPTGTQLNTYMLSAQYQTQYFNNLIYFDNNGNGYLSIELHADIPAGSCSTGLGDSIALNILGVPQAPDLEADTTLCSGNTIVLHPGPVYSSYLWQDGTTDSTYTATTPGLYSVAVTDVCGDTYNASTQVIPANFPFTLGPALTKCNQDSVTLKATGGFIDYQWSVSGVGQPGMTDSIVTVDPLQTTTYAVTADKWAGCAVNSTVQVTVWTSPAIDLGGDTSFCFGASRLLDAGPGFAAYSWNTGQTSEQITVSQAGAYSVAATSADGCTSRDTFQVMAVFPIPQFSLGGTADSTICYNQPIVYTFPADGSQYLWSDGREGSYRLIDTAGTYGLTVINSFGCSTNHFITIAVNPTPQLDLGKDTTLCQGDDLVLNASTGIGNGTYLWQDGSTSAMYTVVAAGIYSVKATAADGCSAADTIQASYIGVPDFNLGQDTSLCPGMTFTLKPSLAYAGAYLWQDGSTQDFMVVQDTGTYILSATNVCGTSKGAIHVAGGLCALLMPNAFTPNGDGRNDVFRVRYPFQVTRFVMAVYDRWGQQVYRSTNIDEGWDGTIHGALAPAGTYVWFISLTDWQNKNQYQKGTVILIR